MFLPEGKSCRRIASLTLQMMVGSRGCEERTRTGWSVLDQRQGVEVLRCPAAGLGSDQQISEGPCQFDWDRNN